MNSGLYGFSHILDVVRATSVKVLGKAGATNGAALAGGTASGAPTAPAGPFDVGDVIVDATGTLWICTTAGTSQSSPGSFTQVGTLVDPLSTRGDLLVRGASATVRLALGATNYVLTSDGTDAVWAVSPAGAGGALTQIAQTVLSGTAASVTFSSIPGTYSSLRVLAQGRSDTAAVDTNWRLRFNSDSGSNYDYSDFVAFGNGTSLGEGYAQTSGRCGVMSAASAPSGNAAALDLMIPSYAGTTLRKSWTAHSSEVEGTITGTALQELTGGSWRSTAAVTALTILPAAGSFIAGTAVTLYGVS